MRIHRSIVLLSLLALMISGGAHAEPLERPGKGLWVGSRSISTSDGYAELSWKLRGSQLAEFFLLKESFAGEQRSTYLKTRDMVIHRIQPGTYSFKVAGCIRDELGEPLCGPLSARLRLKVSPEVPVKIRGETPEADEELFRGGVDGAAAARFGGPDQLSPGLWYDPATVGQGWSFYWANQLAEPGGAYDYDLYGIWYTFEAKLQQPGTGNFTHYRPVVVVFKGTRTGTTYSGGMWITRNGVEANEGNATITFGANNSLASVDWTTTFKRETLSGTFNLVRLIGSPSSGTNNNSHYGGIWKPSEGSDTYVISDLGSKSQAMTVVFPDAHGDPAWVIGADQGAPLTSSTNLCLYYLDSGGRPNDPAGFTQINYSSGCDWTLPNGSNNRNARRYFASFDTAGVWVDFTLPGTPAASGSVQIGTSRSFALLSKHANFHAIGYDYVGGNSCDLTNALPSCTVNLTWFTDSDYPNATAFMRKSDGNLVRVNTSSEPAMLNQPWAVTDEGQYTFQLRMGDSPTASLIAESEQFTVVDAIVEFPSVPVALHGAWTDQALDRYDVIWAHQAPQTIGRFELEETLPSGLVRDLTEIPSAANQSHSLDASTEGRYRYRVRACNNLGCSEYTDYMDWYTQEPASAVVYSTNFESGDDWTFNADGADTAHNNVRGRWRIANPQQTANGGNVFQLGTTVSGVRAMVTGWQAGDLFRDYDVDDGDTTSLSVPINIPAAPVRSLLRFHYYLAHSNKANSVDYLRLSAKTGAGDVLLLEERGEAKADLASWQLVSIDLSRFAGQSLQLEFEANDGGPNTAAVEAAVDDLSVVAVSQGFNTPPSISCGGNVTYAPGATVLINCPASDADGDPLSCADGGTLPAALTVSRVGSACRISGTLTAPLGNYSVVISVNDGIAPPVAATPFMLRIEQQPSNIETPAGPAGPPGINSTQLLASANIGETAGQFRVSENGQATYSIPIMTAPGSGGVAPQVSLDYSSQGGNGIAGIGWAIGGYSTVSRCAKTLEQDGEVGRIELSTNDRFCLDGQRLILVSGSYGANGAQYRTEIDSIARVTSFGNLGGGPAYFKVERKDGSSSIFGQTTNATIKAKGSSNPNTVLIWAQSTFSDSAGNEITFEYDQANGSAIDFVLESIEFASGNGEVSFLYESRPDATSGYVAGAKVAQTRRLRGIQSSGAAQPGGSLESLRYYELNYGEDGMGRSALESVKECRSSGPSRCFSPLTFTWTKSEHGIQTLPTTLSSFLPTVTYGLQLADVNGDSRPDVLYVEKSGSNYFLKAKIANGNGTFSNWGLNYALPKGPDQLPARVHTVDLNADGYQDVVFARYDSIAKTYSWNGLLSNGTSMQPLLSLSTSAFVRDEPDARSQIIVLDFDGDGLSDLLHNSVEGLGDDQVYKLRVWRNTFTPQGSVGFANQSVDVTLDPTVWLPDLGSQGWEAPNNPVYVETSTANPDDRSVGDPRVFDANGDGRADVLIRVWRQYQRCNSNCPRPEDVPEGYEQGFAVPNYTYKNGSFWVLLESTGNGFTTPIVVARGADCTIPGVCDVEPLGYNNLPRSDYVWPLDMNNDGLVDLVTGTDGNWTVYFNTGEGFDYDGPVAIADGLAFGIDSQVRLEDWNGDGYVDLLYPSQLESQSATWQVIYNQFGHTFSAAMSSGVAAGNVGIEETAHRDASIFADFTGNGKREQLFINYDSAGQVSNTQLRRGMNVVNSSIGTEPSNVITRITQGFGAITNITYAPLTDTDVYTRLNDAKNALWGNGSVVYDLIAPMYVVQQVTSSAPTFSSPGAQSAIQYHYVGAKLQAGGRGFLGFAEVISADMQSGIRTNTRYRQDFPFTGLPAETQQVVNSANPGDSGYYLSSVNATQPPSWPSITPSSGPSGATGGTLLSHALNQWQTKTTAGTAVFPYIVKSLERSHTLSGTFDRKVMTTNSYDAYANVLSSVVTTYATDSSSVYATISTVNSYYSPDITDWLLGRLHTSEVTHDRTGVDDPPIVRKSKFEYDLSYTHSNDTGILTKEIIEPDHSDFRVTTNYSLDDYGNREETSVVANGVGTRTASVEYDEAGRFVVEQKDSLNTVVQRVTSWDAFGNPLLTEDIDGVKTQYTYDGMGRAVRTWSQTGQDQIVLNFGSLGQCPSGTAFARRQTGGGAPQQVQCFDILGRVIRSAHQDLLGGWVYSDQYYDSSGRTARVSQPYLSSGTRYWNITTYDILGRVLSLDAADGNDLAYEYDGAVGNSCASPNKRAVNAINGLGQEQLEIRNALGETIEVLDSQCGALLYGYDHVGNLVSLTGADGAETTMSYDLAGRKIAMIDPDKGTWQYAYDPLGQMTRQMDSKNQAIDFEYDVLGRVTFRKELRNVSSLADTVFVVVNTEATTYVTSGHGRNQVESVIYRAGSSGTIAQQKDLSYDHFGRLEQVSTTIGAQQWQETTTYDQYSRVFQQFDASGEHNGVRFVYNSIGHLYQIKEARDGTNGVVYQHIESTDAYGNVTKMTLGNGVEAFATYKATSGHLDTLTAYDGGGTEVQELSYVFDVLGNLNSRHDRSRIDPLTSHNLFESFCYDGLNRLTRVYQTDECAESDPTKNPTLAILYDSSGNIVYKSDVGAYEYEAAQPHAVSEAGGVTYTYDKNGNQVTGDGRTIRYTVFDKADLISRGIHQTQFNYGIGNSRYQRIDRQSGSVIKTTTYLGSVEKIETQAETYYQRSIGGVALARYYPETGIRQVRYLLKDHLGSIYRVLDDSGGVYEEMSFSAFGERRNGGNWVAPLPGGTQRVLNEMTTRGFTGHEHVDEMGIIHMNGRIYDAKLGRFLQADPIVQAPKNSQSLNRYSYVINNPLSYTDPSGFSFFKKYWRVIAAIAISVVTAGALAGAAWTGVLGGFASGLQGLAAYGFAAGGGFLAGAVATGTIRGALVGAFTAAATLGIANHLSGGEALFGTAAVGGTASELGGGRFGHGFFAAGFTAALGGAISSIGGKFAVLKQTLAAAMVGGTASRLTGGKFENGAVTGAMSYAFGVLGSETKEQRLAREGRPLTAEERDIYADHFPAEVLDSARIIEGRVPWWLRKDMAAITIGNRIRFRGGVYVPGTASGAEILGHELVHVEQFERGMTILGYLFESRHGYSNNRFEIEAYSRDAQIRNSFCQFNPLAGGC